jgi:hypothetical protein
VSATKSSDKRGKKQPSATECLRKIKPVVATPRFLISWDPRKGQLRFGCGDGTNEVLVCSNRKLEFPKSTAAIASKLRSACVERFCSDSRKIEGPDLLNRCQALLRSYLYFQDERLYALLAAWSIATYLYVIFSHFGYLFFHSISPRAGKTRVEEILSHLCFEATGPVNSPTVPTIRDTSAEGRTLVLDTLERWKGKSPEAHSAAMELLDAAFRNGGTVMKMVPSGKNDWKREFFPVFAPYILAAIDEDSLTDTALDRSFVIEMRRKPIQVKKRKYQYNDCEKKCLPLRDSSYIWALENAVAVAATYAGAGLEADVDALELNDRAADIWKPLLAVARVLQCEDLWQSLTSLAKQMGRDPDAKQREWARGVVRSLRKRVNGSGIAVGMTSEFAKDLRADGFDVQERHLHDMLVKWGFSQETARLDQGPRRVWELQDSKLAEIERENAASEYPPVKM